MSQFQSFSSQLNVTLLCLFYKYFLCSISYENSRLLQNIYRRTSLADRSRHISFEISNFNRHFYTKGFFTRTFGLWKFLLGFAPMSASLLHLDMVLHDFLCIEALSNVCVFAIIFNPSSANNFTNSLGRLNAAFSCLTYFQYVLHFINPIFSLRSRKF